MADARTTDFEGLAAVIARRAETGRIAIAIVGAPGSGKSTLAERLASHINGTAPGNAAVLPMDGYHFDDRVLISRALRARKGAPETFDVGGLLHMLHRLKRNEEDEIAVPVFDRALEISRAGALLIPRSVSRLIVEGNYLLLDRPPWCGLRAFFDITVAVVVQEDVLRQRLTDRWQGYGLPPEEIEAKVEANDLPNGRFVMSNSVPADFVLS
jgi:pantothenate kinase